MANHIHIFGASGSGVTTLGLAVNKHLNGIFLDTDKNYWKESDPPFQFKNTPDERYGVRIEPGGDMHEGHAKFMDRANSYDHASAPLRSLALHEAWMQQLPCPVLRLDFSNQVDDLCSSVLQNCATR